MTKEEAIHELEDIFSYGFYNSKVDEAVSIAIKALSSEAVQGWIPIEESEPNTTDHVLVTYRWGVNDYEVSELDYWVTKYASEKGDEQCTRLITNVIAWMPLPTPYKGGERSEE